MSTSRVKSKQRVADHGEVFTAEREVRAMLDLLPAESFSAEARFLDMACGDGNFLVELLARKLAVIGKAHLAADQWDELALRAVKSLYGIELLADNARRCRARLAAVALAARRELFVSQACAAFVAAVKRALRRRIVCADALERPLPRTWQGAFEAVVGNPPYQRQINEPGHGLGAVPVYQLFVERAIELAPRYVVMIIPARWYSGGMGLAKFRKAMLTSGHVRTLVDFTDSRDCFPEVDINGGVCYFCWDRDEAGPCNYTNITNGQVEHAVRALDEFDIFVRRTPALGIVRKVCAAAEPTLAAPGGCSAQTPYGLLSTFEGAAERCAGDVAVVSSRGVTYAPAAGITKGADTVGKYKAMVSKLSCEHAGNPSAQGSYRVLSHIDVLAPGEVCTQSYLVLCPTDDAAQAQNVAAYLRTRFARFLILQTLSGMNISIANFAFVPWLDFSRAWTDAQLYERYALTQAEIAYIEQLVRPLE